MPPSLLPIPPRKSFDTLNPPELLFTQIGELKFLHTGVAMNYNFIREAT